jgi:hypothetical protein
MKPKNTQKINELYCILTVDEDGKEGIVGAQIDDLSFPVVFGHKKM